MSNKPVKEKVRQPYMDTDWFAGLMEEVRRSSKTAVATRLGFGRASISQICNGCGLYGDGRASTKNIELAYRREYEQLTCPHTQKQVGVSHCRETALRAAPTHNPMQMLQWQACQQCQYKPDGAAGEPTQPRKALKSAKPDEEPQQAGVIDKVTLPLPEVGGPQVHEEVA